MRRDDTGSKGRAIGFIDFTLVLFSLFLFFFSYVFIIARIGA